MTPEIQEKISAYPVAAQQQLETVRHLIYAIAEEQGLGAVEETLKWGEASYLVKGGTTVRMDWKPNAPEVIKVYLHCQTRLIETFKEIYRDDFKYEGNRAIVIPLNAHIQNGPLSHCIELALKYHSVKH